MTFISRKHAFDSVASYADALNLALINREAAEYIDNTDRRALERTRYASQVAAILSTPIQHDGSDRCPVIYRTPIYIRMKLNDTIVMTRYPERLKWSDVISWVFAWEVSP